MDAIQPEPLSARAHQSHALSIGFGTVSIGIAGMALAGGSHLPSLGWMGLYSPALLGLDDVWYREGPLLADVAGSHGVAIVAIVMMKGLFLDRADLPRDDEAVRGGVGHGCDRRRVRNRSGPGIRHELVSCNRRW